MKDKLIYVYLQNDKIEFVKHEDAIKRSDKGHIATIDAVNYLKHLIAEYIEINEIIIEDFRRL
jgi:hypothetical protein